MGSPGATANTSVASGSPDCNDVSDSDSEGSDEVDVLGMEEEPENASGSDDEDEECTAEEMHKYMTELDEQLEEQEGIAEQSAQEGEAAPQGDQETTEHGLPLGSHHIKVDASEPLELDLHAMEHLLASYCSEHHFEPGPASLLLGELGLAGGGRAVVATGSLDSMD